MPPSAGPNFDPGVCLADLPAETLVNVFSRPTTRETCRARALNKFFKKFVSTNHAALLRPTMAYHRARLNAAHDFLLQSSKVDLCTAFQKCFSYYDHICDEPASQDFIAKLCRHYVEGRYRAQPWRLKSLLLLKIVGEALPVQMISTPASTKEKRKNSDFTANLRSQTLQQNLATLRSMELRNTSLANMASQRMITAMFRSTAES